MLTTATVRELKPRDKMYEVTCAAMAGFVVRVGLARAGSGTK